MNYHSTRTPTWNQALGDSISDCEHAGAASTPQIDAKVEYLSKTWRPTGFYMPQQVRDLVGYVLKTNSAASSALIKALSNTIDTQISNLMNESKQLARVGQQALLYLDAANAAEKTGAVVEAPNLRNWVLFSLNKGTSATQAAYVATCVRPGALQLIGMVLSSWAGLAAQTIDFAMTVVGIAADAVKKALRATEAALDATQWLLTYGPPIGVGALVLWLYWKYGRNKAPRQALAR